MFTRVLYLVPSEGGLYDKGHVLLPCLALPHLSSKRKGSATIPSYAWDSEPQEGWQ